MEPVIRMTRGWEYRMLEDVTTHKRRKGTEEWEAVERLPEEIDEGLRACVVRQDQLPGEPMHWALVIYEAQDPNCGTMILQVCGDALNMHHHHRTPVKIFQSGSYKDHFDIASVTDAQRSEIWQIAHQIVPPSAESPAQVVENCQHWVLRLVRKLVAMGLVNESWLPSLEAMMDGL